MASILETSAGLAFGAESCGRTAAVCCACNEDAPQNSSSAQTNTATSFEEPCGISLLRQTGCMMLAFRLHYARASGEAAIPGTTRKEMTKPNSQASALEEQRFRDIFRSMHAEHPNCLADEWLSTPCRLEDGTAVNRPVAWSRRNGPWRRADLLWVGAAPGNAG